MKNIPLILFFFFPIIVTNAQVVTQSADGKGSLILPLNGVSIGFDIGKTEIAVGANNYSKALDTNNNKAFRNWFFGGNLSVKNSSGIGNLFQSGDIVPAGNFLGFIGFNVNNNEKILDAWNKSKADLMAEKMAAAQNRLREEYGKRIFRDATTIMNFINDPILRKNTLIRIEDGLDKYKNSYRMDTFKILIQF